MIAAWTEQEVVDNYLKPTEFDYLAKTFVEQHITGAALLSLEVRDACSGYSNS